MSTILLTGGAGFIGSHTCIVLLEEGFNIIILDSLRNSFPIVIDKIKSIISKKIDSLDNKLFFVKGDIRDKKVISDIFSSAIKKGKPIKAVIHFAGLKSVKESFLREEEYFDVNVRGTLNILKIMKEFECYKIVFSSSASIYNLTLNGIFSEDSEIKPLSPYAKTKYKIERTLYDVWNSGNNFWEIINLRYFNPAGAHSSGLIGEEPNGIPNNLFPYMTQVATGRQDFIRIFGDDWDTFDGTCVRDYIHIMDLAKAHYLALNYVLENKNRFINLNIGSGIGTSVLELLKKFEKVNNCTIPYKMMPRRKGDFPILLADNSKAKKLLNWHPKLSIEDICIDGWKWLTLNPYGYRN